MIARVPAQFARKTANVALTRKKLNPKGTAIEGSGHHCESRMTMRHMEDGSH